MVSTYSPLKIQLMATGENDTTWGDITNTNLGTALEEAIANTANVTFASADVTLTLVNLNTSQSARRARLSLIGVTGGVARNLIVPAIEKAYIVSNSCADAVTIKNATGTGITVPSGMTLWVYNNATNVVSAVNYLTDLTLGAPLPVGSGGTGGSTAALARASLSAAALGANNDITSLAGLTTPLSPAQGGTGLSAPGAAGNLLTSNGTIWQSTAPVPGGLSAAQTKTANYTAVAGVVLACNTITTGAFSITLPASPVAGQKPIIIFDSGTTDVVNGFATNNLTVLRNGSTINTLADDVVFSTKGVSVIFEYIAGTWRMRIG